MTVNPPAAAAAVRGKFSNDIIHDSLVLSSTAGQSPYADGSSYITHQLTDSEPAHLWCYHTRFLHAFLAISLTSLRYGYVIHNVF
jgi:hypothetical protein